MLTLQAILLTSSLLIVLAMVGSVLRLATHVVLLDSGSVLAQGTPSEISLRPELRAPVV